MIRRRQASGISSWAPTFLVACLMVFSGRHAWATAADRVRAPAVAGRFYAADPSQLEKNVEKFLTGAKPAAIPGTLKALVVPHAGYIYSGIVAAAGYRLIQPGIRTVILLGPSHHVAFEGISIPAVKAYATPLGQVRLAPGIEAIRRQLKAGSIPKAHAMEHCLEVQLPFLQKTLGDIRIIPIIMGASNPEALARRLVPLVDAQTLVVASTDLSHYHAYSEARALDALCTRAIVHGDISAMKDCEACGKAAVLTLMHIAAKTGWQGRLLDYRNSGDTAGDKTRVVGYASIAFFEPREANAMSEMTNAEKQALLKLARTTIAARLIQGAEIVRPDPETQAMTEKRGCFVTLHRYGDLRGCIGTIEPVRSLKDGIAENAINAAFRDPRFAPLTRAELDEVEIEISVLTVPRPLEFTSGDDLLAKLKPGIHGVILSQGWHSATFLPQVWDQLPDPRQFLAHLCRKAGLDQGCWRSPQSVVKVYEASYFSEDDMQ